MLSNTRPCFPSDVDVAPIALLGFQPFQGIGTKLSGCSKFKPQANIFHIAFLRVAII